MPHHKGFIAAIYDASTSLPFLEYASKIDDVTSVATSYIESTADQPFTIVLRDTLSKFSQGAAVYVDGVYVDNGITGPGIATERRWFGKRIDHLHVKPFVFRHNLSDVTTFAEDQRIGTISLVLRRCQIGGLAEDQTNRGAVPEDVDVPSVRNMDAKEDYLAHRAEYGSPTPIPATLYHVSWTDPQPGPAFVEFRFIYRSREVLVSKGVIPGSPAPEIVKALPEEPQKGRKRKLKSVANRKKANKNEERPISSPTTIKSPETHLPESRLTKKSKITIVKTQTKKDITSLPPNEESPIITITDPRTSPPLDVVQRHQKPSQPIPTGVLNWVESQSANVDILRELRELRDEVKRLKQAQYPGPPHMMPPLIPGVNPYYAMASHPPNRHIGYGPMDGNVWNVYAAADVNNPPENEHELR